MKIQQIQAVSGWLLSFEVKWVNACINKNIWISKCHLYLTWMRNWNYWNSQEISKICIFLCSKLFKQSRPQSRPSKQNCQWKTRIIQSQTWYPILFDFVDVLGTKEEQYQHVLQQHFMENQLDLTFKQHDNYLEILLRDTHYVRIKKSVEEGAPMYEFYILESLVQDIHLKQLYCTKDKRGTISTCITTAFHEKSARPHI